jgi:hypothetical protein
LRLRLIFPINRSAITVAPLVLGAILWNIGMQLGTRPKLA